MRYMRPNLSRSENGLLNKLKLSMAKAHLLKLNRGVLLCSLIALQTKFSLVFGLHYMTTLIRQNMIAPSTNSSR